jgi:hypothetical protein
MPPLPRPASHPPKGWGRQHPTSPMPSPASPSPGINSRPARPAGLCCFMTSPCLPAAPSPSPGVDVLSASLDGVQLKHLFTSPAQAPEPAMHLLGSIVGEGPCAGPPPSWQLVFRTHMAISKAEEEVSISCRFATLTSSSTAAILTVAASLFLLTDVFLTAAYKANQESH